MLASTFLSLLLKLLLDPCMNAVIKLIKTTKLKKVLT